MSSMQRDPDVFVVVVGAGPAGLTAAHKLAEAGLAPLVLEADPKYVGGISRTAEYAGYHFDIGGHRFFSKAKEVEEFWTKILPNDLLTRPRKSRIYYDGKFFSYPLKPFEALMKLGLLESSRCMLSFAHARVRPVKDPTNLEDWVRNQFGRRLYEIFFKYYTEKVWGMDCRDLSADWAAQRIKGLNLGSAVWNAIQPKSLRSSKKDEILTTLIDEFRYPRKGPGQLWEEAARQVGAMGGRVAMGTKVTGLEKRSDGAWDVRYTDENGDHVRRATHVISSAPLREVIEHLSPAAPPKMLAAARALKYRDFLTVALIVKERGAFDDNWIYIQDKGVKVGRIQNFKTWSPEMVPDADKACYGLEYFCFEGDGLWSSKDSDLVALGARELEALKLGKASDVLDGCVVRQPKAYPVYDDHYADNVDVVAKGLAKDYAGLHMVGRNGMHRYNNQDHSMMTAMLTVENILAEQAGKPPKFDPWRVNQDAVYIEAGTAGEEKLIQGGGRAVPRAVAPRA
jgi:protoporphyrinogen oxidase